MKKLIALIILISSFANAQFYEIDYEVQPQIRLTAKAYESLNNHYKDKKDREKAIESIEKIDTLFYKFSYNNELSQSAIIEKIDNSQNYNDNRIQISPKIGGKSYVNYNEMRSYTEKDFLEKAFNVYDSVHKINFVDTGKTKTILGIETKEAKGNYKDVDIVAWYAPSIPYNYSPDIYYGTKGLILELHYKYIHEKSNAEFMISWIATKKKELRKAPVFKYNKKLETISLSELSEMQSKKAEEFKDEMNRGVEK